MLAPQADAACMRYTVRNVPPELDRALRERARRLHKSLDEVVMDALRVATGTNDESPVQRDLSDIIGTWQDDPEMARSLAEHRRIDPQLWPRG